MPILVSGSLVYDHIMNFPDSFKKHIMPEQIHILNVCFMVDTLKRSWGGTAGNIAFTMKLLGGEPLLVSVVGKDGTEYLDYLRSFHINTGYIATDAAQHTASCYITTDADDNQITAFYGGPLGRAHRTPLITLLKERPTLALISPTDKGVMMAHLKESKQMGARTICDPGQQITAFSGEELESMIRQSDFLIGNDYEIKLIQERTGLDEAAILQQVQCLIITLGGKGSVIKTADGAAIEVPVCPPRDVKDPTGAGDAYRAGFFVGYEWGLALPVCGRMGAVAASYAIETYGTQAHRFTKEEFCERYTQAFGEKLLA